MADTKETKNKPNVENVEEEETFFDEPGDDEHLYDDWDDLASDPEDMSRLARTLEGLLPDIVKKSAKGLVSEDGIRSLVKDRELPREAVGFLLGQLDATRGEAVRIVSKEVRTFLENIDLGGELTKILTSVSFEIRTEVRFIPNDASVKPNVRNRVSVRGRNGDEKKDLENSVDDDAESEDEESVAGEESESGEDRPSRRRRWSLRGRGGGEKPESTDEE